MLTAVDSSVLLDVIIDAPRQAQRSENALRKAAAEGGLIICECVLAEIRPAFRGCRRDRSISHRLAIALRSFVTRERIASR